LLAEHFWREFRPAEPLPAGLLGELAVQPWPGNVRELRNAVERSALVGWQPSEDDAQLTHEQAKAQAVRHWEKPWIERLLAAHDHTLSRAARAARMGRTNLRRLVHQYGLAHDDSDD
jgi:DNA-binding NtrC family response regulator